MTKKVLGTIALPNGGELKVTEPSFGDVIDILIPKKARDSNIDSLGIAAAAVNMTKSQLLELPMSIGMEVVTLTGLMMIKIDTGKLN